MIDTKLAFVVRNVMRRVLAMSKADAANILGIPVTSPLDVIKKAYLTKVVQNHPDRGGTTEGMVRINVAFEIMTGKRKEDRYDYSVNVNTPTPAQPSAPPAPKPVPKPKPAPPPRPKPAPAPKPSAKRAPRSVKIYGFGMNTVKNAPSSMSAKYDFNIQVDDKIYVYAYPNWQKLPASFWSVFRPLKYDWRKPVDIMRLTGSQKYLQMILNTFANKGDHKELQEYIELAIADYYVD